MFAKSLRRALSSLWGAALLLGAGNSFAEFPGSAAGTFGGQGTPSGAQQQGNQGNQFNPGGAGSGEGN